MERVFASANINEKMEKTIDYQDVEIRDDLFYYKNTDKLVTGIVEQNPSNQNIYRAEVKDGMLNGIEEKDGIISYYQNNILKREKILSSRYVKNSENTVIRDINYKNGKLHGSYQRFHENGQLELSTNCLEGEFHGKATNFYDNGQVDVLRYFYKGDLSGICKFFYKNGTLKSKSFFNIGKMDGEYISYYENGELRFSYNFKNGVPDGKQLGYYANGILKLEGNFKNQNPVGEWRYFYPNGHLKRKGKYKCKDGKYKMRNLMMLGPNFGVIGDGDWEFFDDTGKLIEKNTLEKTDILKNQDDQDEFIKFFN